MIFILFMILGFMLEAPWYYWLLVIFYGILCLTEQKVTTMIFDYILLAIGILIGAVSLVSTCIGIYKTIKQAEVDCPYECIDIPEGDTDDNTCIACGCIIPEGRRVCIDCEQDAET